MTTLVVLSDLHIGPNPSPHRFFRGEADLARALRSLADEHGSDLHVILNGDTLDFLMASGKTKFNEKDAVTAIETILKGADGQALVTGLNHVLGAGGQVTIRLGNHDPELRNPAVRARFETALVAPVSWDEARDRREEVGGVPVLIEHGAAGDAFNDFEHSKAGTTAFEYPAGSKLVVDFLQGVREKHHLGFLDALKPDFLGAVLAALLVKPQVGWMLFGPSTVTVLSILARWKVSPPRGLAEDEDPFETLYQEVQAYLGAHSGLVDEPEHAPDAPPPTPETATSLLERVVPWIRRVARKGGAEFFDLTPPTRELDKVWRGRSDDRPFVVIQGHSHAARFWSDGTRAYVNTGTWGALMKLPEAQEDADTWTRFYAQLREKPELTEENTYTFFSAARVREAMGGAEVELIRWDQRRWVRAGHTTTGVTLQASDRPRAQVFLDFSETERTAQEEAVRTEIERIRTLLGGRQPIPAFARAAIVDRVDAELGAGGVRNAAALLDLLRQLDEQRRNPAHLDVLHAADRIARAMHDWVLQNAAGETPGLSSAPLPPVSWLESVASPVTWNRKEDVPAPGLAHRGFINLPFPIVIVPTDHLDRPWRLLSVLHEVGHNLDHALGLSVALKAEFAGQRWDPWAEEIVADLLATAAAGLPYVRVLDWIIRGIYAGQLPRRDGTRYPPPRLRLAILERFLGADGRFVRDCAEDLDLTEPLKDFDRVLRSPVVARLRGITTGEGPPLLQLPAAYAPDQLAEPPPSPADRRVFRAAMAQYPPPEDALTEAQTRFLQGQHTRFAPASIDATGSLLKMPRPDLMLEADHMWFVGATQENLLATLNKALERRGGRPWRTIEVFFVGRDEDLSALYPGSPTDQIALRDRTRAALIRAFQDVRLAEAWRVYHPTIGQLYASFYLRRDPGYPDSWYVHTSAPVWGKGIRSAPSTDYQSVSRDLQGDPEIRSLVEGLENLRGRAIDAQSPSQCLTSLLPRA